MPKPATQPVAFRAPRRWITAAKAAAKARGMTLSDYIRESVEMHTRAIKSDKNPMLDCPVWDGPFDADADSRADAYVWGEDPA